MSFADREPVDVGYPMVLALLQADYRIPLVFFRQGIGEWVLAPGMQFELAFFVICAAAVRLAIQWLISLTYGPYQGFSSFLRGETTDLILWGLLAAAVFFAARPHAVENVRRARTETEIIPTSFIGWPRGLNASHFDAQSRKTRRRIWRNWALVREPLIGAGVSLIAMVIDPWIGTYLMTCVAVLMLHNASIFQYQRMERLGMSDAMWDAASKQRLLEELQAREEEA